MDRRDTILNLQLRLSTSLFDPGFPHSLKEGGDAGCSYCRTPSHPRLSMIFLDKFPKLEKVLGLALLSANTKRSNLVGKTGPRWKVRRRRHLPVITDSGE
jgi:hypothetical protein